MKQTIRRSKRLSPSQHIYTERGSLASSVRIHAGKNRDLQVKWLKFGCKFINGIDIVRKFYGGKFQTEWS